MNLLAQAETWKSELEKELHEHILGFWMKYALDEKHGGFLGEIATDLTVRDDADKSLVLNARILWTFAAAYRLYGNETYLQPATRAYQYILRHFVDREYGGLFWMLHADGSVSNDKKQVYGQAFAIYALSEYYRAVQQEEALDLAIHLFRLLEEYSYDSEHKGYLEALSRSWQQTGDFSLSDKDLNEKKSMNTHLHVLEAYTNLYRVWPDPRLHHQLTELIEVTLNHIVHPDQSHFLLFFDETWVAKSDHISYGHDIEGSWLMAEAAEVLGDEELLSRVKQTAVSMAEHALARGVDQDGGMVNEANASGYIDTRKDWWPQAEAMVGFYNAYQLTGDIKFREASLRSWQFIGQSIIDHEYGEWFWNADRKGRPNRDQPKVSAWKCPYHNGRACMEMIERLS
ncbi:N-acyl-D-glucosamine 2-epimerase [Paenibacillus sp. HJL G12]|uniref:Cellobiose 2-epimerase n=1 Tax=Paenibacillus dendrobii TaxID=2691084 RepID=A0A7X3LJP3_9BACL|nr:AGE family epimerase/isomerase [Paenibacillus dendrobii]MWV46475.1 N-acyl-D-glucosamine 2-epimerase [Paenibacillus dendrobii]